MADNLLKVKIQTPTEVLFDGIAIAVSSKNSQGKFDILGQHANFISIIEKNPIIVLLEDNKNRKIFNFNQAIIYTFRNQVNIFADPISVIKN